MTNVGWRWTPTNINRSPVWLRRPNKLLTYSPQITELYMNVYIQTCLSEKIALQTLQTNFGKHFLLVHISHQVLYLCLFSFLFSFLWTPLLVWCFSDLYMDTGSFWLMTLFCTKMSQQLTTIVCQTLSAKKNLKNNDHNNNSAEKC